MNGYSELDAIYFSIGSKTAFAKYTNAQNKTSCDGGNIVKSSYIGEPPYKAIKKRLSKEERRYHAAEHQVYNCFMAKIKKLPANSKLCDFQAYIPKLEELNNKYNFSYFCGTSFFLGSAILVLLAALPNSIRFQNHDLLFMIFWLAASIFLSIFISRQIQNAYYISPPKDKHKILAIEALKEVLRDELC